jgi:cysteine-rich repeat protein
VCGDGFAELGVEACDDGNSVEDDACTNTCTVNTPIDTGCPGTAATVMPGNDVTLGGDTSTSQDNYVGSCGGDAPDVVFAITASASGLLNIGMIAVNDDLDPVLYVRDSDCEGGAELGCADATFSGGYEELNLAATAGHTYYVFADGYGGSAGEFLVSATLLTQVPGDDCPGLTIPVDATNTYTVSGNTSVANPDRVGTGACSSASTKEIVYKVVAPASGKLFVSVDPSYDASVYIRTACTSPSTQVACAETAGVGGLEVASTTVTAGSTYYVFVDGKNGSSGAYSADFFLQ